MIKPIRCRVLCGRNLEGLLASAEETVFFEYIRDALNSRA